MVKKQQIAILYENLLNWMGGTLYVINLVSSFSFLDEKDKPIVNLYCSSKKDFLYFKKVSNYPYLKYHKIHREVWLRGLNKLIRIFIPSHLSFGGIDISKTDNILIFPVRSRNLMSNDAKVLGWIPDFQELHYPMFFSKSELKSRDLEHKEFFSRKIPMVYSSNDALSDVIKFYPEYNTKKYILHFAVSLPDFSNIDHNELRIKYGINKRYFFCANQFWPHKNHLFLFKVFKNLIDKGADYELVCSGKLSNDDTYSSELMQFIYDNKLQEKIKILGLIDRKEQLNLMDHSYAIIQPSLFEGWSSVVEDAKALNKFIFLSKINVHLEQNPKNVCFFNPCDAKDLQYKLENTIPTSYAYDYKNNQLKFANDFIKIVNDFGN